LELGVGVGVQGLGVGVGVGVRARARGAAHRRRRPRDVLSRDLVHHEGALEVREHRHVLARAAVHAPAVGEYGLAPLPRLAQG